MAQIEIKFNRKSLRIYKCRTSPDIMNESAIVTDPWLFVDLWLAKNKFKESRSHWNQAKEFSIAAKSLSLNSSPLPAYYAISNATKALLLAKSVTYTERHGVSGSADRGRSSLSNELVKFHTSGVLNSLCKFLGEEQIQGPCRTTSLAKP